MTLVLPERLEDAVVRHAREGAPEEVVGVFAGERDTGGPGGPEPTARVERLLRAENAAERPETRYEIAPAEELALLERVEEAGDDVVGFYHSHPTGPLAPSPTDERLAAWPDHSYVIVSLAGDEPAVASWRWTGETFDEEPVVRPSPEQSRR